MLLMFKIKQIRNVIHSYISTDFIIQSKRKCSFQSGFASLNRTFNLKVSGPFVETLCVFHCIKSSINAEMWA